MRLLFSIFLLVISTSTLYSQSIAHFVPFLDWHRFAECDIIEVDSLLDVPNGYYENSYKLDEMEYKVLQAAIFKDNSGGKLLAVTGRWEDMWCYGYKSSIFKVIDQDSLKEIHPHDLMPVLKVSDLLRGNKVEKVLKKYLPEIREKYLDEKAGMKEVLNEIYDLHYIIPRHGTTLKVTLSICDYIPGAVVEIPEKDWKVIENGFSPIELEWDKRLKRFIRK